MIRDDLSETIKQIILIEILLQALFGHSTFVVVGDNLFHRGIYLLSLHHSPCGF